MKLTRDYITNHIETTGYPIWGLFVVNGYKRTPVMFYNGDDWTDNESAEGKVKKAVARLNTALDNLTSDVLLSIDIKNQRNATGTGILGPFEFYNHTREEEVQTQQPPQQPPQQGFAGFGFPQIPPGYVSEEMLNGKLEAAKVQNRKEINDLIFAQQEKEFEERRRRERAEIAEMKKELADERKKYESNTGAAAETLFFAVKKILAELFPQLPFGNQAANAAQPALAGAAPEETQDAKYLAVEELANSLYSNPHLTEHDIKNIAHAIQQGSNSAAGAASTPPSQNEGGTTIQFPGAEDGVK